MWWSYLHLWRTQIWISFGPKAEDVREGKDVRWPLSGFRGDPRAYLKVCTRMWQGAYTHMRDRKKERGGRLYYRNCISLELEANTTFTPCSHRWWQAFDFLWSQGFYAWESKPAMAESPKGSRAESSGKRDKDFGLKWLWEVHTAKVLRQSVCPSRATATALQSWENRRPQSLLSPTVSTQHFRDLSSPPDWPTGLVIPLSNPQFLICMWSLSQWPILLAHCNMASSCPLK